jgi:enoyl-CoA hydratase/carnithine racemase
MTGAGSYETLIVERRGAVGWLEFNRPDVGNAMNAAMLDELERAWRELDADPDVRVIVNTGRGRAFQTGLDVVELAQSPDAIALVRKSPMEPIMRMALTGRYERLSAARAYELGILSQVVDPPDRLADEAMALAEKIAQNSPAAMRATKKALWGALEHGLTDACRAGAQEIVGMWGHPDQTEGPLAFVERREPRWLPLEATTAEG